MWSVESVAASGFVVCIMDLCVYQMLAALLMIGALAQFERTKNSQKKLNTKTNFEMCDDGAGLERERERAHRKSVAANHLFESFRKSCETINFDWTTGHLSIDDWVNMCVDELAHGFESYELWTIIADRMNSIQRIHRFIPAYTDCCCSLQRREIFFHVIKYAHHLLRIFTIAAIHSYVICLCLVAGRISTLFPGVSPFVAFNQDKKWKKTTKTVFNSTQQRIGRRNKKENRT